MMLKKDDKINIEELRRETKRFIDDEKEHPGKHTLAVWHGLTFAGQEYFYSVEKGKIIEIVGEDKVKPKINKSVKNKK